MYTAWHSLFLHMYMHIYPYTYTFFFFIGAQSRIKIFFLNEPPPENVQYILVGENGNEFLEPVLSDTMYGLNIYEVKYVARRAGSYLLEVRVDGILEEALTITAVRVSLTFRNINFF